MSRELLSWMRRVELTTRLGISGEEIARWGDISRRMVVFFHSDGIISQFEGYEQLRELDWEDYRATAPTISSSLNRPT